MAQGSLEALCAGLFMVGFPGRAAPEETKALIRKGLFGAILFARNVGSVQETAELVRALKGHAGRPFALAVDQEGGRVARLKGPPFTAVPPMRALGLTGDEALAKRVGRLLAYEVRSVGFDWDFAPVLDVDTNPKNPVIGDRSFHRDAAVVARLGVALGQGMEAEGVASCAKHFPGHGDTAQDSHHELPRLPHDLARLNAVELPPFAAWAKAGLSSVMTAHVVFDAVDKGMPATMSAKAMGLLREQLGFQGVLVSDDLEMKAIAAHYSFEEAVVRGAQAGVDLFLVCREAALQQQAIEALVHAVERGVIPRARLEASKARLDALAHRFVRGPETLEGRLGSSAHLALRAGIEEQLAQGVDPTERA